GKVIQQVGRNPESALGIGESHQYRFVAGIPQHDKVKGVQPIGELQPPLLHRQGSVVGNVIAPPHEGIYSAQRLSLAAWQYQERVIEVLRGSTSDRAAYRVGNRELRRIRIELRDGLLHSSTHRSFPRAARASRASLRVFGMAGRRPRTAYPCRSIALSISKPPRLNSSMSMASSRSTLSTNGNPCWNHSRARSTSKRITSTKLALLFCVEMSPSTTLNRRRSSSGR